MVLSEEERKERHRESARKCMAKRRKEKNEIVKKHRRESYERNKVLKGRGLKLPPSIMKERKYIQRKNADFRKVGIRVPKGEEQYTWFKENFENKTCCELCYKPIEGINKCLDHCHKSGYYRWVVCRSCNRHLYTVDKHRNNMLNEFKLAL